MLYPQKNSPLTHDQFQNPTSEYRATPFWAWNNRLDAKELCWQIEQLKKLGFGGFHMHVRTGMATEYLSDEYMGIVAACVEKARDENMLAWLYDEDRWPSGAAGGIVTKNPAYRSRHLLLTRHAYGRGADADATLTSSSSAARTENGRLLACYDAELCADGFLQRSRIIGEDEDAQGVKLYAYVETSPENPWFNNQTYANTLDPATIQEFIRVTYERYLPFQSDFGGVVPAIFTDEPQFAHKQTLAFAHEDRDIILPWTDNLPETYAACFGGEDLVAGVPELIWDLAGGRASTVRYHYHDHISERFSSAFADQCGDWCDDHGLMLTGHMMEEATLRSQTAALGEAMRSYRSFQLPGIDMLCDMREYNTAKQAQSAARQYGRAGVLSELYGVTNWDFDFRGHKLQGDWQAALGVTVRVPHLSWVSMNGEAKRDYPSTFNYQSPWYEEYPYVEDHFARVNTAMTRGSAVCRVGVIHPVESYWLQWGPGETTSDARRQLEENFDSLTQWLLRGQVDFDFICESLLPEQCAVGDISAERFPVGHCGYEAVLVPPVRTLRASTLERLEAFRNAGGKLIFLGDAPTHADAHVNDWGLKLYERSERVALRRLDVLTALDSLRDIEIRQANGDLADGYLYQLRQEDDCQWLFIAHADRPVNPDIPGGDILRIRMRGSYAVTLYDSISGGIVPLASECDGDWTMIRREMYEHDSLLLKLERRQDRPNELSRAPRLANSRREGASPLLDPVKVTLHEPNVLLLDMAEYALDDGAYRPLEEILRLENGLRGELGWPKRGEAFAQPWVENDESTPHTLHLRYHITSEIAVAGAKLALENADATRVTLGGEAAGEVDGWYTDKCIGTVALPAIAKGDNILELTIPYGRKTDVEACYLLGDFGVRVSGISCTLTPPVRTLDFGDITRQGLPFYGGNLTYHLQADISGDNMTVTASYYRSHLLRVRVDGSDAGVIAYSPYRVRVDGLEPGRHSVDITCFGSRVNTFGQLHRNDRYNQWWGPNSWRTEGAEWTYQYRFWEQGVLKAPEIIG